MIIFLTLCYIAVLFLLMKLRVLPDNLFVRLSPVGFMVLLFLFLFVPMQWGAPAGPAVVVRNAVAIVPNVPGQVVEVAVQPNQPVKKGDVLFRIDPTQYQAKVDELTAQLKLAELREQQYTQLAQRLIRGVCDHWIAVAEHGSDSADVLGQFSRTDLLRRRRATVGPYPGSSMQPGEREHRIGTAR